MGRRESRLSMKDVQTARQEIKGRDLEKKEKEKKVRV